MSKVFCARDMRDVLSRRAVDCRTSGDRPSSSGEEATEPVGDATASSGEEATEEALISDSEIPVGDATASSGEEQLRRTESRPGSLNALVLARLERPRAGTAHDVPGLRADRDL